MKTSETRTNAGYEIISAVRIGKRTEVVIGHHNTAPSQFVTWYCNDESDYFTGAYYNNYADALKKLIERVSGAGICEYTKVID